MGCKKISIRIEFEPECDVSEKEYRKIIGLKCVESVLLDLNKKNVCRAIFKSTISQNEAEQVLESLFIHMSPKMELSI